MPKSKGRTIKIIKTLGNWRCDKCGHDGYTYLSFAFHPRKSTYQIVFLCRHKTGKTKAKRGKIHHWVGASGVIKSHAPNVDTVPLTSFYPEAEAELNRAQAGGKA